MLKSNCGAVPGESSLQATPSINSEHTTKNQIIRVIVNSRVAGDFRKTGSLQQQMWQLAI
jgi:hypothetical protein